MTLEQVAKAREMLRKREPFGRIYAATSISSEQLFALLYGLRDMSDADAAEYWQRNLASLTTCEALHQHFKARAYPSVEANQFEQIAALVVRLRNELEHTNQHLVAHIDALTKSNAQCGEYLRRNEQLHSELVDVRAALAATTEQRDSLRRTLYEWEHADTKPHERVAAEDVADHVVPVLPFSSPAHENKNVCGIFGCDPKQHGPCPLKFTKLTDDEAISRTLNSVLPICMRKPATETTPVLPMCNVCHGCGGMLIVASNSVGCYNVGCRRTMTVPFREATVSPFHPYYGPCSMNGACSHG